MREQVELVRVAEPSERRLERCHGAAELRFAAMAAAGGSYVRHLYQRAPCRVLFPHGEEGDLLTAVLLTTSGGITGGDRLELSIEALPGAAAVVTTQAAEKIYRSLGDDARIDVALTAGAGAWLEWLPQETILFDGARLARRIELRVPPGGRLLASEMLVFGRTARGERFLRGRLHDGWRVRYGARLVWADGLHLAGNLGELIDHPAGFDGAVALATLVYAAEDAGHWLEAARGLTARARPRAAATMVNGVLLVRLIGRDAQEVREAMVGLVTSLRAAIAGLPPRMPRVWAS
ncbi:MAG: urease accessory protein UreD [Alphaproteobacteria bacterium]